MDFPLWSNKVNGMYTAFHIVLFYSIQYNYYYTTMRHTPYYSNTYMPHTSFDIT